MSNFKDKFNEIWSDKRKRAGVLLFIWFIFLALVVAFSRSNYKAVEETKVTEPIGYVEYDNYEYTITSTDINGSGVHYANKSLLTLKDGSRYYIEDDNLYKIEDNKKIAATDVNGHTIIKLQPKYLGELINKSQYEYSATTDGVEKKSYSVSSDDYYAMYNMEAPKTTFIIPMYVYIKDGYVIKVEFSDITITYSNIGNITSFNNSFE